MEGSPPEEWGRRLSDRIRAALRAGDFAAAARLAREGDGDARDLAREYALMTRGLGLTIRILLDLLGETLAQAPTAARGHARDALLRVVDGFDRDLAALAEAGGNIHVTPVPPKRPAVPEVEPSVTGALASAARVLAATEEAFLRQQARRAEEALRAIEARDPAGALAVLDQKERGEYLPLHDRLIRFMAEAFGWVLTHGGPEALLRFHRETAERQRPGFEKWERLPARAFARATAFLLKQHMGEVEVSEDPRRFTIVQRPCGSGGRLRLQGAHAGAGALPFVEGPGLLTAGQARLPVYCTHCPVWNVMAPLEWFGRAQWLFEDPARPDGSCTLHIAKDRDTVPAAPSLE
jgi:hypothetical protein